ncbi:MAG TPA: LPS export ABC transporter periplasmic protein LptC [Gemmatimonadales bacterium]|nr:LPS export ABC transporter periplasmic protein LptC [Gemmatimonadales bacterium]
MAGTARRAALTLALCLMAVAAGACGSESAPPSGAEAEADSADQRMFGVSQHLDHEGIRRSTIQADTAYLYDARQVSVLLGVRATFYDEHGVETSSLTARRMEYDIREGSLHAEGDVVLTVSDGRRLTSESLIYDPGRNSLSSNEPFLLTRGAERVEGDGFRADADFRNFVASRPRAIAGDSLILPGQ